MPSPQPFYQMEVLIDPDAGRLSVKLEIQNPDDSVFYLCSDLIITKIRANGKKVAFQRVPSDIMPNSSKVNYAWHHPEELEIEYEGKIVADSFPSIFSQVNMIRQGLVELAGYANWFPRFSTFKSFSYELKIIVPKGYFTITNGEKILLNETKYQSITTWKSINPTGDILLFAAPEMKRSVLKQKGLEAELYYDKIPVTSIDSLKCNLLQAFIMLKGNISSDIDNNLIRVVFSPRSGWGYVRTPLIIVDETGNISQLKTKYGEARTFRYIAHEIAHYWWSSADASGPDDWINEGLAEYSALWLSEALYGQEFSKLIISEYEERVNNSDSDISIAETTNDSKYREINRYDKAALLFYKAGEKFGKQNLLNFLSAFYARSRESVKVNTSLFLETAEIQIGKEAGDFFREALFSKKPGNKETLHYYPLNSHDSLFLGSWEGILKQSGFEMKVVMHFEVKDDKLVSTTDSPDQNVFGIQVSEVLSGKESIQFKIPVASAKYKGNYDQATNSITGIWTQRGMEYPLILKRQ
jgi:hypothetical protein